MTNQIATNKQLVPVFEATIGGAIVKACDARALHTYLEVGALFSNWIKDRIEKYKFQDNQDFIGFFPNGKKPQGGRPSTEYHLTLDMAKELAMVENNDRGREARRYFIRMEKAATIANEEDELDIAIRQSKQITAILVHQKEMRQEIKAIGEKLKEFDSETGYRTVLAYARDKHYILPTSIAQQIGKDAARLCRQENLEIGRCSDERYGQVNSYPIRILEKVFK